MSAGTRLLGVAYGTVRIGLAVSDPGRTIASPLTTYARRGVALDARYFHERVATQPGPLDFPEACKPP